MLDTSQSYLPLRRGSSDDDFEEKSPALEKQQPPPPTKWGEIPFIVSVGTNIATLSVLLPYLFFYFFFPSFSAPPPDAAGACPATTECSAATTAYPQTSYSKPKKKNFPCRSSRLKRGRGEFIGKGKFGR